MKAFVLSRGEQKDVALQKLVQIFSPSDIRVFEDENQLDIAVRATADDILFMDFTTLDSNVNTVNLVDNAIEQFTCSGAELLTLLDYQGHELLFLKIFKPHIWNELSIGSINSRTVFPLIVSPRDIRYYNQQKHASEAEKYRDRIGDRLASPEKVQPELKHLIQDDIQRVKRVLSIPVGERLFDVGCSDGSVTIEMVKKWQCKEALGIDVVASSIEEANGKAEELGLSDKVHFLKAFIEDLDSPNGYFHTIAACEVLEHVGSGQLDIALGNLTRILRDDGNMIITVPNRYPASRYVTERRARWEWFTHCYFFTQYSLEVLLKEYFSVLQFLPLYPEEEIEKGIYLIVNCWGKRR